MITKRVFIFTGLISILIIMHIFLNYTGINWQVDRMQKIGLLVICSTISIPISIAFLDVMWTSTLDAAKDISREKI